jgi:hypothetical protein
MIGPAEETSFLRSVRLASRLRNLATRLRANVRFGPDVFADALVLPPGRAGIFIPPNRRIVVAAGIAAGELCAA